MQCPKCQTDNPEDSKYCKECSSPLSMPNDISDQTKTLITPVLSQSNTEKYKILEEIGRGGMGIVYKAHDTNLNRTVALKFLPPGLTHDKETRERFIQEAQTASGLDHPNVCTIFEIEKTEDDRMFIAMAFYEGESLKERIHKGSLQAGEAKDIATQISLGLKKAHKKGIVHRDIKPANIFITSDETVKILDFGLAKLSGQVKLTRTGTTMGTIAYMSPEQAQGKEVDNRTDIWSLGVVLYEMLTGKLPFKGENEQSVLYSILNDEPDEISGLDTKVTEELNQILHKLLAKSPNDRYQSIIEFLDDLKSVSLGTEPLVIHSIPRKVIRQKRKRGFLYVAAVVLPAVMVFLLLVLSTNKDPTIKSIAILPFENLSGDTDQDYLIEGIHAALNHELDKISALRIISRTSILTYKTEMKPLAVIAQELNVDAVIEASVFIEGSSMQINTKLIRVPSEDSLWLRSYEREINDILILMSEIAQTIAREIKIELSPEEKIRIASARSINPEAYKAYTKGRFHLFKLNPQDFEIALGYFEMALEKDPNYALAYVGICLVWGSRLAQGLISVNEARPKIETARQKALELDDTLEEVHYMLAQQKTWQEWDWEGAEKEFKRAIELNPNYPEPRAYYSWFLFYMKRPEEAMVQIERALELDPFNATFRSLYAWDLMYAHRYDDAVEHLLETFRTAPTDSMTLSALKSAYHLKGMHEEAIDIWKTSFAVKGDSEAEEALMRGYADAGYSGALSRVAEMLIARSSTTFVTPWQIGTLYTRAGKNNEALIWLEKAYEAHDSNMPSISMDPIFDGLRDDPRFLDLIRRMNFPDLE